MSISIGDIGSFIRSFWESPSSHSQRRCQELCHENYVKIYGKYFISIGFENVIQLTFYIPQIFKENLVQQVKTEAQIQVMCDHHPFLVRGPFRWQNKRNLFIGNLRSIVFDRVLKECAGRVKDFWKCVCSSHCKMANSHFYSPLPRMWFLRAIISYTCLIVKEFI